MFLPFEREKKYYEETVQKKKFFFFIFAIMSEYGGHGKHFFPFKKSKASNNSRAAMKKQCKSTLFSLM